MCGCTKKATPRAQAAPSPRSIQPAVARNSPVLADTVALRCICAEQGDDIFGDVPSGSHYQIGAAGIVRVYATDLDILLARSCGADMPAFERLN